MIESLVIGNMLNMIAQGANFKPHRTHFFSGLWLVSIRHPACLQNISFQQTPRCMTEM